MVKFDLPKALVVSAFCALAATGAVQAQTWDGRIATDIDLEWVVYSGYNGAREYAIAHDNYFMWSAREFPALRDAIIEGLELEGYDAAVVERSPSTSVDAAIACGEEGQTELRVRLTSDGGGILLVAVTSERMAAYEYDPDKSSEIIITAPQDCGMPLAQGVGMGPEADPAPEPEPETETGSGDYGNDIVDVAPGDPEDATDAEDASDDGSETVSRTKDKG